MALQWKRRHSVGLGLSVALVLAVVLPATASAVSTLTGESLNGISASGNSGTCPTTYSVSGFALKRNDRWIGGLSDGGLHLDTGPAGADRADKQGTVQERRLEGFPPVQEPGPVRQFRAEPAPDLT